MTIVLLIQEDRPDEYTGKRGLVKQQVISGIEIEGDHRLTQFIEYSLSEDEKKEFAGKLMGKRVKVAVRELTPFGGKLRMRGKILEVLK